MNIITELGIFVFIIIVLILLSFSVFSMGFLFGYKIEDKKITRKKSPIDNNKAEDTNNEKRAKKEWKKFLEYDGSTPTSVDDYN